MKFATLLTPSSVYMSRTPFSKTPQWAQYKFNFQTYESRAGNANEFRNVHVISTLNLFGYICRFQCQCWWTIRPRLVSPAQYSSAGIFTSVLVLVHLCWYQYICVGISASMPKYVYKCWLQYNRTVINVSPSINAQVLVSVQPIRQQYINAGISIVHNSRYLFINACTITQMLVSVHKCWY